MRRCYHPDDDAEKHCARDPDLLRAGIAW